jgi:hypothetical protein
MTAHLHDEKFPEQVVIDGYVLTDACWLLDAVEKFARLGDVSAVVELIKFADNRLSPDGLASIAGEYASRLGTKAAR